MVRKTRGSKPRSRELPVEIWGEVAECADISELNTLRLVSPALCHAVDCRSWREIEISLLSEGGVTVKSSVLSFKTAQVDARLLDCLERNAARVVNVVIRIGVSFSVEYAANIYSMLRSKGINVQQCILRLRSWNCSTLDDFEKAISPVSNWNPSFSIELYSTMKDTAAKMIHAFCPSPEPHLEISISDAMQIKELSFSLFLTYGDAVKSMNLIVEDVGSVASTINLLEFCTNLETLHIAMNRFKPHGRAIPEGTKLCLPKLVKEFSLSTCHEIPAMAVIAPDIEFFHIDCKTFPPDLQLHFSSLGELRLVNCVEASSQLIDMLAQMGSREYLRLDTTSFDLLVRFKPLIKKTKALFDVDGTTTPPREFDFDYLDRYTQWLGEMKDSIQHLQTIVLPFPLLPPEKLKRFIVESIYPLLPKVTRLYFRRESHKSCCTADLERLYPFLTPHGGSFTTLWYMPRNDIKNISKELAKSRRDS